MKSVFKAIDKIFGYIEKYFVGALIIIFTLLMFCNVVGRYCFAHGIFFAEEASRYLNAWAVFIGIAAGIKYGSHIGIDAVVRFFVPEKGKKIVTIIAQLIGLAFCLIVFVQGILLIQKLAKLNQITSAMQIPMWIPYLSVPVGMGMATIRYLIIVICEIFNIKLDEEVAC